jgi:hypothetical protein
MHWRIITRHSYVVVTAAEAKISANPPERFIGDAKPIVVGNVTPQSGAVQFTLWWYGDFPYLDIWTDVTVFDPNDPSIMT